MLTEYRLGSYNNTSSSVVTNGAGAVILGLAIFRCCPRCGALSWRNTVCWLDEMQSAAYALDEVSRGPAASGWIGECG
jgi:hypothetical protein